LSGGIRAANQAVLVPAGKNDMPSKPKPRPNRFFGAPQNWVYNGKKSYHARRGSFTQRGAPGPTFKGDDTHSEILDINSAFLATSASNEPPAVLNPFDLKHDRGPASYNLKHQFNANYSYQLPIGRGQRFGSGVSGVLDKLFSAWQWNGNLTVQSG